MKLRLQMKKTPQNEDRCRSLGVWIREKGWAQSCRRSAKGDAYVIELAHFFPLVLSLRERRMASTDYCSPGRRNHLFVANDFLVTIEVLLSLLHTTQQQLVSIESLRQEEGESNEHIHE